MRKASLGTLFLTVFLDLLGFGLVIPFLPGVARHLGASDFVATLPAVAYSLMQFLFIPIWGRLSDRVGRRPVLLWSIAATAGGHGAAGRGAEPGAAVHRALLERHRHREHRGRAGVHRRRHAARAPRARHGHHRHGLRARLHHRAVRGRRARPRADPRPARRAGGVRGRRPVAGEPDLRVRHPPRIAAARGARQIDAADEPARFQATARLRRAARRGPGDRDQLQHGLLVRRHGADLSAVHRGPLRHERLADRPDLRRGRHRRRHGSGRADRAAVAPLRRRAPLAQRDVHSGAGLRPARLLPADGELRAGRALRVGGPDRLRQRPLHAHAAGVRLAARRRRRRKGSRSGRCSRPRRWRACSARRRAACSTRR